MVNDAYTLKVAALNDAPRSGIAGAVTRWTARLDGSPLAPAGGLVGAEA